MLAAELDAGVIMSIFDEGCIVFLSCTCAIFGSPNELRGPVPPWLVGNSSRWLPA